MNKTFRIPSLDGLRGVAILLVLLSHASHSFTPEIVDFLNFIGVRGALGVKIFFVLSGYLIYTLSIKEIERYGQFDIKMFYIRRIYRIFPLFYLYLIVLLILQNLNLNQLSSNMFISASTFSLNYRHLWDTTVGEFDYFSIGHYWTLALEEQFYLTWPLLIFLLKTMLAVVIIAPFIRVITYFLFPESRGQLLMMFHTGFDAIAIGVLMGEILRTKLREKIIKFCSNSFIFYSNIIFIFFISQYLIKQYRGMYEIPIGQSLELLSICMIIIYSLYNRSTVAYSVLNSKILIIIGVLSYSLYIWNNIFLLNDNLGLLNIFPYNFILLIIFAVVTHYLVEKPFLKLKNHFHKNKDKH